VVNNGSLGSSLLTALAWILPVSFISLIKGAGACRIIVDDEPSSCVKVVPDYRDVSTWQSDAHKLTERLMLEKRDCRRWTPRDPNIGRSVSLWASDYRILASRQSGASLRVRS